MVIYHHAMCRVLILIMIVLLPLRGWASDFMGIEMAVSGSASTASIVMPPGCPMHVHAAQGHSDQNAHGEMKNCVSCGLCIPLADLASGQLNAVTFSKHAQPRIDVADFVSASLPPTSKPPIF